MNVSVIIPSLNQAQFLEQAICSVVEQRGADVEVIVIDGGSTDGSVEIIRRHAQQLAHWVSEPDCGQSDALNKGLSRATGDVVGWLNSDDFYVPGAVATAVAALRRHTHVGMVYGDCLVVSRDGTTLGRQEPPDFVYRDYVLGCNNYIPSGSTFMRRDVMRIVGAFDVSMHHAMDQDMWLRIGLVTRVRHVPTCLSAYRVYSEAKTWSGGKGRASDLQVMYRNLTSAMKREPQWAGQTRSVLGAAEIAVASRLIDSGASSEAWTHMARSVANAPAKYWRRRGRVLFNWARRAV